MVKNSFRKTECGASVLAHRLPDWDPEWIEYRFACFAQCSNDQCKQTSVLSGVGETSHYWEPSDYGKHVTEGWEDSFTALAIIPAPRMFVLSRGLPKSVRSELNRSFGLFWNDQAACLNALRGSLERAMDELRVKKYGFRGKKAPRTRFALSLHVRIAELRSKYPEVVDTLIATKWITNAGSHGETVDREDLFDAMDLAEHSLNELFDSTPKRLEKLAKSVNKRKGPTRSQG